MNNIENNSRISRIQRHQKKALKKRNKKNNFSSFKIFGVIIVLAIIIYLILNCSNAFSTKVYADPLQNKTQSSIKKLNGSAPIYQNYSPANLDTVSGYMKEQAHILKNIERFDVNTALSMNYYDIVNLYPDSINSANAFQSNFLKYSSILSSSERNAEEPLVNEIFSDNTSFINSIIQYSNLLHSGATANEILSAKSNVQNNFQTVTNLINKNINLF